MEIDLSAYKDSEIYVGDVYGRADIELLKTYKVIKGDVNISRRFDISTFEDFTVEIVTKSFNCSYCDNLESLEGLPKQVGWHFDCSYCHKLKDLKGAPLEVGSDFECDNCDGLISLDGAPLKIEGYFDCSKCSNLKSLQGAPLNVGGYFACTSCKNLKSLEYSPLKVGGNFNCNGCYNLESLEGAPKEVEEDFKCSKCTSLNALNSAKYLKDCKINGEIICDDGMLKICIYYLKTPNEFIDLGNVKVKLNLKNQEG